MRVVNLDTPSSVRQRPSAAERELVIRRLREGCEDERLSLDTFSARVEEAFVATSRAQLEELVVDLPGRSALVRALSAAVRWVSRLTALVEDAWRETRTPPLALPVGSTVTLGRSRDCDCVLTDPTVSRRHACVRHRDGGWWLRDLGSFNGTYVNGCRVLDQVEVRAGDRVSLGATTYRLCSPASIRARLVPDPQLTRLPRFPRPFA
jgi:hypothetical protein